jgi:hypothetical protein
MPPPWDATGGIAFQTIAISDARHVFQAAGLFESLPWKVKW